MNNTPKKQDKVKKNNSQVRKISTVIAISALGIMAGVFSYSCLAMSKKINMLTKNLESQAKSKSKEVLKKYSLTDRISIVHEYFKNKSSINNIDTFKNEVNEIAKSKKIKTKSEKTFMDNIEDYLDIFVLLP